MANVDVLRALLPTSAPPPPAPPPTRSRPQDDNTFRGQLDRAAQDDPPRPTDKPTTDAAPRADASHRTERDDIGKDADGARQATDATTTTASTTVSSAGKPKPVKKAHASDDAESPQASDDEAKASDATGDDGDPQPVQIKIDFDPQAIAASSVAPQAVTVTAQTTGAGDGGKLTTAPQPDGGKPTELESQLNAKAAPESPYADATSQQANTIVETTVAEAGNGHSQPASASASASHDSQPRPTATANAADGAARAAQNSQPPDQPITGAKPVPKGNEGKSKSSAEAVDASAQAASPASDSSTSSADAIKPVAAPTTSSGAGDALAAQHLAPANPQQPQHLAVAPVNQVPLPTPSAFDQDDANVGRVVRGLQSAVLQQGGTVSLRLQPPDLGVVRIQMAVQDGVVSARFMTEHDSVRHLLNHQLGALRDALEGHGLVIDRLEVQTLPGQDAGFAQQHGSGSGFASRQNELPDDGRSRGQMQQQTPQGGGDGKGANDGGDSFAELVDAMG